ncbi:MAG: CHASE3 domain-containing protein [Gemmatimonadota bacterium]|nr:CHASE3 domain-containing protein [Gemmatimonadota bacterium]
MTPANSTRSAVPLRLKLSAALGVALVILLVGVASLYALRESANAAAAVQHTELVHVQLERTLTTILNAETGQRGYLLTHDTAYLQPYVSARTDAQGELAALRQLTTDNQLQQRRIDSLDLATDAKLVQMNETVVLTQSGQADSALKIMRTGVGAQLTAQIRRLIATMEQTEADLLAKRTASYDSRKTLVVLVSILGSLLAAALSIITMLWLRTGVKQLENAKDTIEEQAHELTDELARSNSLTDRLATTNENLQRANTATEAARAQFEQLLESTDEGLYGIDADGVCTFMNRAGAVGLGYEAGELIGKNMHDVLHHHHADGSPYNLEDCSIYKSVRDRTTERVSEDVFWSKDRRAIPIEYTSSPIVEADRTVGAVIAFNDIASRKRAERERERLISALARSNTELDQFAYVASHDLKAPLRGIANLSQWIEEDLGDNAPPDVVEKMTLIRGRVQRLELLIDGILQYSRAGRVRSQIEAVDVDALLRDAVELLAPPSETTITIGPGMPTITTERTPLQQVFMNLISNAIKYNRRPGATIDITVKDVGRMYAFSVKDNGPGIEQQYHERIFGIFQTLESRDRVEGTGIGLSVVKKTVELHGGSIHVDSALGEGATFTFEWPKVAEENAAA